MSNAVLPVPPRNNQDRKSISSLIQASDIPGWSIRLIAWAVIGVVLYIGKPAFAPMLLAMLLALLLSPVVDFFERYRVPRMAASLGVVLVLIALLVVIVDAAWGPTQRWVENAPEVLQTIEKKVRPVQLIVKRIESITTRATTIATGPVSTTGADKAVTPAEINPLSTGRVILIDTVTISILTLFLLMGGNSTLRAVERASQQGGGSYKSMKIIESVRAELSRYYLMLTAINICLGVAVACAMALWGLPSPWLWGIMAGVLNFIPYVGPSISLAVLSIVSLVTFDGYGTAIGVASTFLCFTTIEGQLIQPLLIGFRLNLNPIVLFVSIWLAGWFWGVAGVFLITPSLVILKEIASMQDGDSLLKALLISHYQVPLTRYRIRKGLVKTASGVSPAVSK